MGSPFTTMNGRAGYNPAKADRRLVGGVSESTRLKDPQLSGVTECTLGVPKATSGPGSGSAQRLRKASAPDKGSVISKKAPELRSGQESRARSPAMKPCATPPITSGEATKRNCSTS